MPWGMKEEPILQIGTDKIILIYVTSLSRLDSLTEVNGKMGFNLKKRGVVWYTVLKQMKTLGQGCMDMTGEKGFASALGNTPQHSRQKCLPSRHVQ